MCDRETLRSEFYDQMREERQAQARLGVSDPFNERIYSESETIKCQCGCDDWFRPSEIHEHRLCGEMIADDHVRDHETDGECNMQAFWALKH